MGKFGLRGVGEERGMGLGAGSTEKEMGDVS